MEKDNNKSSADPDAEEKLRRWGPGEWVDESNNLTFIYKDVLCDVHRDVLGELCGYMYVKPGHPWYKKGRGCDGIECDVHGEISFSEEDENGDWIIGFDCGHYGDLVPFLERPGGHPPRTALSVKPVYRNLEFVILELHRLVDQYLGAAGDSSSV